MARKVARIEGLPRRQSPPARGAIAAGVEVGLRPENKGKMIVIIVPSIAER